jgi:hypothetical protein
MNHRELNTYIWSAGTAVLQIMHTASSAVEPSAAYNRALGDSQSE